VRACQEQGQRAIARASGVSLREVSDIVHGKRRPRPQTLYKLLRGNHSRG
jgi:transcriptional regulator with XRE-family HTH domain